MTSKNSRLLGLDGLRALAIALVLANHAAAGRFEGGGVGVAVFFVLSGYLITSILVNERATRGRVRVGLFYVRRALRLWPALLAMLVLTVPFGASARSAFVAGTYLTDIVNIFGKGASPYGHTWSLGVEEQFYLVWPLCLYGLLLLAARARTYVLLAASLASVLGCALWTAFSVDTTGGVGLGVFNPLWQCHGLLIGGLLALVGTGWRVRHAGPLLYSSAAVILLLAVSASIVDRAYLALVWNVPVEIVTVVLIICLRQVGVTVFSWRPVVWLGQRSYAVYLWHLPLIILSARYGVWQSALIGVAGSLVAAELSARVVEAPVMRLRERLDASTKLPRPSQMRPLAEQASEA